MDIIADKPADYMSILKSSIRLYNASVKYVLVLALFLSAILFSPKIAMSIWGPNILMSDFIISTRDIATIFIYLGTVIFFIAIMWRMNCEIKHKHERLSEDLNVGIHRVLYVFAAAIIQSLLFLLITFVFIAVQLLTYRIYAYNDGGFWSTILVSCAFALQVFVMLYLYALFLFYLPIIAVEGKGVISGIKKSINLVWGHWWMVFSVQITPWLIYAAFLLVLKHFLNIDLHFYIFMPANHSLLIVLLHVLFFAVYVPWVAATLLVQLKDLELRKKIANGR